MVPGRGQPLAAHHDTHHAIIPIGVNAVQFGPQHL
jgi:hypothetical protein